TASFSLRRRSTIMSSLDRLREKESPSTSPPSGPSPEMILLVNQITDALNALIEQVTALQKSSHGQPDTRLFDIMQHALHRIDEIEKSQTAIVNALDGKQLRESAHQISIESRKNHAAMASAIESLTRQADENRKLFDHTRRTVARIEQRAAASIDAAAARAGEVISEKITANLNAVNERADAIIERADRIDSRQAWSAAAAMFLLLLPVATVVAGVWMSVAGLVAAFEWAGGAISTWGRVGKFIVAGLGTAGAVAAFIWCVRWVSGVIGVWRDRGMPDWPRWLRRR
ncbi:MAG: hypothetical protein E6049_09415, partial [Varibaculum cambriense]|nr:hypothetical protein [Varibaculum cambriense]